MRPTRNAYPKRRAFQGNSFKLKKSSACKTVPGTSTSADVHPAPVLEGARHRVHGPLDQNAGLKIDRQSLLALHAADELPAFDRLQIVESEVVAGRRDEAVVGLV